jgi:hypothetical protein
MDEREYLSEPLKQFLNAPPPGGAAPASSGQGGRERRRHTRFRVSPMYSRLVVRRIDPSSAAPVIPTAFAAPSDRAERTDTTEPTELLDGHIYDISEGGVRFELDEPLGDGEVVVVEISLPGCQRLIRAEGKIVRVNDAEDDPGPRRMALRFDRFADEASRAALSKYLGEGWLEAERAA